ncbi:hypothetical protein HMPREF3033_01053 [Veillonellaceae bacterium DNF00751]|nr:hypothetical protein HMPREF3033_01053 [Veillonellaceae bacterium DNF00751]
MMYYTDKYEDMKIYIIIYNFAIILIRIIYAERKEYICLKL